MRDTGELSRPWHGFCGLGPSWGVLWGDQWNMPGVYHNPVFVPGAGHWLHAVLFWQSVLYVHPPWLCSPLSPALWLPFVPL